jgi:hypothetical protein
MPLPVAKAAHLRDDFKLTGDLSTYVAKGSVTSRICPVSGRRPELSTDVRLLWSDSFLRGYKCPFTAITEFKPTSLRKSGSLMERTVKLLSLLIRRGPAYSEFEVAPNGEKLDVRIAPEKKDFEWSSGFECAVRRDEATKIWTAEMRIPLSSLTNANPKPGGRWRINLYRCDYANRTFFSWNPTLRPTFHAPERFGWLEFLE